MCQTLKNMDLFRKESDSPVSSYSANPFGSDALHFKGRCWSPTADEHL